MKLLNWEFPYLNEISGYDGYYIIEALISQYLHFLIFEDVNDMFSMKYMDTMIDKRYCIEYISSTDNNAVSVIRKG